MQSHLSVSVRDQAGTVILDVNGELDLASAAELERIVADALRARPPLVLLELGKLRFMDMSGLRVLLGARQLAEERGARLLLANARPAIRRLMVLAQVDDLLAVLDTGR